MNKRQKAFVQYYAQIGSETYGNGTKSAQKAGYSVKSADKIAVRLLKTGCICEGIRILEKGFVKDSQKTREEKRALAWDNYNKSTKPKDKQFWWQEVCKLDGDYITKSEITQDLTISQDKQDFINERIREAIKN